MSEDEHRDGREITPPELFFDVICVFAITQVTSLLAATRRG